jgi:hypothetical protein
MMRATSIRQILGKVDEELLLEPFGVAVQVSHGRSKVNMPHLLLNRKDPRSRVHQVCRQRVTEKVRVDALADASTLNTGTATTYIVVTLQNSVSADSCYVSSGSVVLWPKG